MEENLIKLLELNYLSMKESEIINIINKKCYKDLNNSLDCFLVEIENALHSDYLKKLENRFQETDESSSLIINEIQEVMKSIEEIKDKGEIVTFKSKDIANSIMDKFNEVNSLESQYFLIENQENQLELISAIQASLILDDIPLSSEYLILLIKSLQPSSEVINERQKAIYKKLLICHKLVNNALTNQFQDCLKELNWPLISNNLQRNNFDIELEKFQLLSEKFSSIFNRLFLIEIPVQFCVNINDDDKCNFIQTNFINNYHIDPICTPVQILLQPLVKYFKLFFWSDRKLNKLSKPEWYMTQVIQWIAIHHEVLEQLFNDSSLELIDGRLEFVRGLVIMVMEKVQKDLELISTTSQNNDELFFHLVEESLTMTMDIRRSFDYPKSYPDPIDVICNCDEIFENWMKLEQRFAAKQLDEVFRSPNSWQALSRKCKSVECLDSYIRLINAMKMRIQCISDISKQTRFSDVLLEVLDDFRRRLLQISKDYNANSQRWYDIMNVVYSVKILLRNWRLDQMFISIHDHILANNKIYACHSSIDECDEINCTNTIKSKIPSFTVSSLYSNRTRTIENLKLSSDSVFSNVLSLYQHVLEEMEEQCIISAFEEVSDRADPYIKSSWLEVGPVIASRLMNLSPAASGMLLALRDRLHGLESALESELFEHVWQGLACKLNKLVFDCIIRTHKFNELGASQLDFDIRKNLLPLFLPYTKTPERFFVKCLEACILLNLKCGTAMLIKEILAEILHSDSATYMFNRSRPECPIRTLSEIGVLSLMPEDAEFILKLRIDISIQ